MEETKKCPFCAEEIKAEAIKCKHCGSDLNNTHKGDKNINIPETIIEVGSFQLAPTIKCNRCQYEGKAQQIKKGSGWITLILLLFYIIPGIIYIIWRGKAHWGCPRCKNIFIQKISENERNKNFSSDNTINKEDVFTKDYKLPFDKGAGFNISSGKGLFIVIISLFIFYYIFEWLINTLSK